MTKQTTQTLRNDLTPEQREQAEKIGRIEFKSAGAVRKTPLNRRTVHGETNMTKRTKTPEQKARDKANRLARKVAKFERQRAQFARMVEMKSRFNAGRSAG